MFAFINVVGVLATLAVFALLAAKRYPGRTDRVIVTIVAACLLALLWPLTLWVGVGLWLRGHTAPLLERQQYKDLQTHSDQAMTYALRARAANDIPASTYWSSEANRAKRELDRWL